VTWSTDRGPSKTIQRNLRRSNTIGWTWVRALRSDSAVALGSRSSGLGGDGPGTTGQVSCSGMGGVLSFGMVAN